MPVTPTIPLPIFQVCYINIQQSLATVQLVLPLVFGEYSSPYSLVPRVDPSVPLEIAVFVLITTQVRLFKSRYQGMNMPKILKRIGKDAEIYFIFITVYNLLAVVMYFTVKVGFSAPVSEF